MPAPRPIRVANDSDEDALLDDDAEDGSDREPERAHRCVFAASFVDRDPGGVEGDEERQGQHGAGGDEEEAEELVERVVECFADAGDGLARCHAVQSEQRPLDIGPGGTVGRVRVHDVGERLAVRSDAASSRSRKANVRSGLAWIAGDGELGLDECEGAGCRSGSDVAA